MKKFLSFLMIAALIMGMSSTALAKEFKGVVTYKITYPGADMDASMAAMMPKMATLSILEDLSKFEISMGQMGRQITIIDGDAKTVTNVMDFMGQKYYYVETEDEINAEAESNENVTVDIKDETKEIAGYTCNKAVITIVESGEEMFFTIYYTEEIGSSSMNMDNPYFKEVPGAMLEFEVETGMGKMKMEAISVSKQNLSASDFEVPEGFEEKTKEEIEQMMGGGR